jgi:hypothetical protein
MPKYAVGGEVTVRGVIAGELDDGRIFVAFPESEGAPPGTLLNAVLTEASIATHTPKPREFNLGDIVTWGTGAISLEFLAARNGMAIMWNNEEGCVENEPLSDIRHADEAAP